ncbi:MAG: ATP-binding protein, partial [Chloroflexota bacterium]
MRAMLGFDGTARELLTDLAGDGGAVLFVDNLDFFSDEERRTVVDLVREAAGVPGFAVMATARRNFGVEEPNWLPSDALDRLGRAEPIVIGELSEAEVDEIRHAALRLASLLADAHPARDVTRNLFRLARLADRPGDAPILRTEVDMADQWWKTADGRFDGDHRDRARLLKVLAQEALLHAEPLDVSHLPARAIDALVKSETLRDLGNDRVAFRHDVLREWAIGNLLHSEPTMIERLPLKRPASPALARGVELTARMALERAVDASRWQALFECLNHEGMHGSWRRAALLALVRSEVGTELLTRASAILLANRAGILCELIRIVMAVDVEPASKLFAAIGVDPAIIIGSQAKVP